MPSANIGVSCINWIINRVSNILINNTNEWIEVNNLSLNNLANLSEYDIFLYGQNNEFIYLSDMLPTTLVEICFNSSAPATNIDIKIESYKDDTHIPSLDIIYTARGDNTNTKKFITDPEAVSDNVGISLKNKNYYSNYTYQKIYIRSNIITTISNFTILDKCGNFDNVGNYLLNESIYENTITSESPYISGNSINVLNMWSTSLDFLYFTLFVAPSDSILYYDGDKYIINWTGLTGIHDSGLLFKLSITDSSSPIEISPTNIVPTLAGVAYTFRIPRTNLLYNITDISNFTYPKVSLKVSSTTTYTKPLYYSLYTSPISSNITLRSNYVKSDGWMCNIKPKNTFLNTKKIEVIDENIYINNYVGKVFSNSLSILLNNKINTSNLLFNNSIFNNFTIDNFYNNPTTGYRYERWTGPVGSLSGSTSVDCLIGDSNSIYGYVSDWTSQGIENGLYKIELSKITGNNISNWSVSSWGNLGTGILRITYDKALTGDSYNWKAVLTKTYLKDPETSNDYTITYNTFPYMSIGMSPIDYNNSTNVISGKIKTEWLPYFEGNITHYNYMGYEMWGDTTIGSCDINLFFPLNISSSINDNSYIISDKMDNYGYTASDGLDWILNNPTICIPIYGTVNNGNIIQSINLNDYLNVNKFDCDFDTTINNNSLTFNHNDKFSYFVFIRDKVNSPQGMIQDYNTEILYLTKNGDKLKYSVPVGTSFRSEYMAYCINSITPTDTIQVKLTNDVDVANNFIGQEFVIVIVPFNVSLSSPEEELLYNKPLNFKSILLNNIATLSWDRPDTCTGGSVEEYEIYRNNVLLNKTTSLNYINKLNESGIFKYKVRAKYASGYSEFTSESTIEYIKPTINAIDCSITQLYGKSEDGKIYLYSSVPKYLWFDGNMVYNVYKNNKLIYSSSIFIKEFIDNNLTNDVINSYYITTTIDDDIIKKTNTIKRIPHIIKRVALRRVSKDLYIKNIHIKK